MMMLPLSLLHFRPAASRPVVSKSVVSKSYVPQSSSNSTLLGMPRPLSRSGYLVRDWHGQEFRLAELSASATAASELPSASTSLYGPEAGPSIDPLRLL